MSRKKIKNVENASIFDLKKDLMKARFKAAFNEALMPSSLRNLKKQIVFLSKKQLG